MTVSTERRRVRSNDLDEAIQLQLRHVAEVMSFEAIVLTDDLGIPKVRIGNGELTELLAGSAMWARFSDMGVDAYLLDRLQDIDPSRHAGHVHSEEMTIGDTQYCLLAVGPSHVGGVGVEHAATGVRRIHATLAA